MRDKEPWREEFLNNLAGLSGEFQDEMLWDALIRLQGGTFSTAKGLEYTYRIKGGEMFISRTEGDTA